MEPKTELLVFSRKEVGVILTLLVLVALFSFTIGIKLGRNLKPVAQTSHETANEAQHSSVDIQPETAKAHKSEHSANDHTPTTDEHKATDNHSVGAPQKPSEAEPKTVEREKTNHEVDAAEDKSDHALNEELQKEKIGSHKPVILDLPKSKKAETKASSFEATSAAGTRYTLQMGSHRSIKEATDQVEKFKADGLEAFYTTAKVHGKGTWYRVGVGLFPTKDAAETAAAEWKKTKALPDYLVQKVNE